MYQTYLRPIRAPDQYQYSSKVSTVFISAHWVSHYTLRVEGHNNSGSVVCAQLHNLPTTPLKRTLRANSFLGYWPIATTCGPG